MSDKTKTFVKGAAILGVMGLICKVIGAIFRIPLTNIIDIPGQVSGMAYYQMVYPVYALLLVVSTAGLPAAISKMVSERRALSDYKGAENVFKTSFKLLLIIGVVSAVVLFAISKPLAILFDFPEAAINFMMLSPAVCFVAIISSYRGYFQGMQMMAPTGVSQLLEQLVKLLAGLYFAKMFLPLGPQYGAAGALLGVSLSEILALILLFIIYQVKKPAIKREIEQNSNTKGETKKQLLRLLLKIAIPVTIGACIMPIVMAIDTVVVIRGLKAIGFTEVEASSKFAHLTAYVNSLVNMPAVLSLALAMSLVPAISSFKAKGMKTELKQQSGLGFKIALLVGLPSAVGLSILAKQVLLLLYKPINPALYSGEMAVKAAQALDETVMLLVIMSIAILMLTMLQTMTGILQGLGKVKIPVINLGIAAIVKIIVSVVLIRIPNINIVGAAIGTVLCYGIAAILNVYFVVKHTGMKISMLNHITKPVVCTALMGMVVYLIYPVIFDLVKSNTIATLGAIIVGAIVYAGALIFTKTITKEEIALIRGKRA